MLNLTEAFKSLDSLNEEAFDISTQDGVKELDDFLKGDDIAPIEVIDVAAEDEDDLEDSYVGKVILSCPVCKSVIYRDKEDIKLDDDHELANTEELCPYCHTLNGFKIVGQVEDFCDECEEDSEEDVEITESVNRRKKLKEAKNLSDKAGTLSAALKRHQDELSSFGRDTKKEDIVAFLDKISGEVTDKNYLEKTKQNVMRKRYLDDAVGLLYDIILKGDGEGVIKVKGESLKEDDQAADVVSKYQKWVDYDMKKYGRISDITKKKLAKAGFEVVKDDHGDYEVIPAENMNEFLDVSASVPINVSANVDAHGSSLGFLGGSAGGIGESRKSRKTKRKINEARRKKKGVVDKFDEIYSKLTRSGDAKLDIGRPMPYPHDNVTVTYDRDGFVGIQVKAPEDKLEFARNLAKEYNLDTKEKNFDKDNKILVLYVAEDDVGDTQVECLKEDTGLDSPGLIYDQVLKILDDNNFDVEDIDVQNYAKAAADYIQMTREETDGRYSVRQWFRDTKENYPEDFDSLAKLECLKESIEVIENDWGGQDLLDNPEDYDIMLGDEEVQGPISVEDYIDDANDRMLYDEERVNLKDVKTFEFNEDGFTVTYKDGKRYIVCDRGAMGCRGWFEDDTDESLNEDFKDVTITTDDTHMEMTADEDGKVTVTTEPVKDDVEGEVIAPVDTELKTDIDAENTEDEEEIDFNEIDDSVEDLGESYLKSVYDNVKSFKLSSGSIGKDSMMLEGVITFNSGKQVNTTFNFEGSSVTKRGKLRLLGENKQITSGKKAFMLTGKVEKNKFIAESLNYRYRAKDSKSGKSVPIYGTVRRSK